MIASSPDQTTPVLTMAEVRVWTPEGVDLLGDLNWTVAAGEHWALLGPNGSGKSTLLSLAGAVRHPSSGRVTVLGGRLGQVDMPALRRRIGVLDPSLTLYDWLTAEEIVLTGETGTVRPVWHRTGPDRHVRARARDLLDLVGCGALAEREIATCSQGERQRVRIARALMPDPALLLLDEPAVGLDLPSRETLLSALSSLVARHPSLATILVTHHLEELPPTTSHALLLRGGGIVAAGRVATTLTSDLVSACFGLPLAVRSDAGRWTARLRPAGSDTRQETSP